MTGDGYIRDAIERIRLDVLHLEIQCTGHFLAGSSGGEVRALAERLAALTRPDKGHLPAPVSKSVEIARAA